MRYLRLFEDFKNEEIKAIVKSIVDDLTIKYRRGNKFFDALDEEIKSNNKIILELVKDCEDKWIISSGGFGDVLYNHYLDGLFKCKGLVVFNGKMLTNNIGVQNWKPSDFDLDNKEFVYIDDSYFSGGTVKKIDDFLKLRNSSISQVNVVYDGSEIKKDNVNSFYRYWDYRDLEEYKKRKKE